MTSKKGREHPSAHTLGGKKTTHVLTRAQFHHSVAFPRRRANGLVLRQAGPRGIVVEIDDQEHGTAQISIVARLGGQSPALRPDDCEKRV